MPRVRTVALAAVVAGLVLALLVTYAAGPWKDGYRVPEGGPVAAGGKGSVSASAVLAPSSNDPAGAAPTEAGLREVLQPLFTGTGLGPRPGVSVVDIASGRQLYGSRADDLLVPASTNKIPTAVAALAAVGPDKRISTRVVQGAPGRIVLVGGGDPTLTALTGDAYDTAYGAASLDALARRTAEALKAAGTQQVQLSYDTSLYTGPDLHPIGVNDNIARVTPLMVDLGRVNPRSTTTYTTRVTSPAQDAAAKFAQLLGRHGVTVTGTPSNATAPAGAAEIAAVQSPTIRVMVERMLTESDNDVAEALQRQVAIARGRPVSFEGGSAAVRETLESLGVQVGSTKFTDGSGLDRANQISASTLTRVLALAASPDRPELRPALTGLPVAGFTGTLSGRYGDPASARAAGVLRAKTGTLTGVSALAGIVLDRDGRVLAFAFLTDGVTASVAGTEAAQKALDAAAAALAGCGCGTPAAG